MAKPITRAAEDHFDDIILSFQQLIPALVLMNERAGRKLSMLAVDMQTLHLIALHAGPLTPSALATVTELPPSTVTRVLDRLEARGFISRVVDRSDQRRTWIVKNAAKINRVRKQFDAFAAQVREFTATFDAREQAAVARFMKGLVALV